MLLVLKIWKNNRWNWPVAILSKKRFIPQDQLNHLIPSLLEEIQEGLFDKALQFRDEHITEVKASRSSKEVLENKGGFIAAHWDGTAATEEAIKQSTKATIRCIPYEAKEEEGVVL